LRDGDALSRLRVLSRNVYYVAIKLTHYRRAAIGKESASLTPVKVSTTGAAHVDPSGCLAGVGARIS
jgi:hypothetical protein